MKKRRKKREVRRRKEGKEEIKILIERKQGSKTTRK